MDRSAVSLAAPAATGGRILHLDAFRGLALVMIFINHVPGTVYEYLTNRNFGFSDAAEGFVLMSGIAAGLAYVRVVRGGGLFEGILRCSRRAFTLYWVHMVITAMALAISAAAARFFGVTEMIETNNVQIFYEDLTGALIGLPLLTHQLGYLNILPLYSTLLLVTPLLILFARRPAWLIGGSILLWFAAGLFRLNFPNYPTPGGWFFNPFSWQLIFVIGLLTGLALKEGRRLVPANRVLFWGAVAYLLLSLAWVRIDPIREGGLWTLGQVYDLGAPFHLVSFDKTFLALPRLLHALALFYVISCLPACARAAGTQWAAPLVLMGRHALPVFALGSVLSILLQAVEKGTDAGFALDTLLIVGGIAVQWLFAWGFETIARRRATRRAA